METRFFSWNVNGLRSCAGKGFLDFLAGSGCDVAGLQEIKMTPEQAAFSFPGYYAFWHPAARKGYSGTLALSKREPLEVRRGMDGDADDEGRVLTLTFPDYYFVCLYAPNAQRELTRLDFRCAWQDRLRGYVAGLASDRTTVICGDLNVAHRPIDLKRPKANEGSAGYTPEERAKMDELLAAGFTDTFRLLHPAETDAYTWWSYQTGARAKNVGWRIDYFLVSDNAREAVREAVIFPETMGSDHCPVGLTLAV